jgi:4-amino-4-deoxy-L-arabinose transferase-like glycosyltransferase
LLAALFPWSAVFLWSLIAGSYHSWKNRTLSHSTGFFLTWAVFCISFFSISQSKLPGYILPALPALTLLAARAVALHLQKKSGRWVFSAAGMTLAVMGVLAFQFDRRMPFVSDILPSPGATALALPAIVGGAIATALASFRRMRAATFVLAVAVLCLVSVFDFTELDAGVSARPVVKAAMEHVSAEQAAAATVFKLRRAYKYQVDFYLHRETHEWSPQTENHSIVFTDYGNSQELLRLGGRCPEYVAFPAVWVCEDGNGDPILANRPAGSGQPQ